MTQCITLGETMVAFTPMQTNPLRYVTDYRMHLAGAESNVAIGLAKLGVSAMWISCVGQDEFGHFIRNQVRAEGVDCQGVRFDDDHRTGVMFKQPGVGETSVYYYRENSAASCLAPEDLQEEAFAASQILHLTGITPVLSKSCCDTVLAAIELAEAHNLQISFDPNIRKKLWGRCDYTDLLRRLTLRSHIVLMGLDEGELLFGTRDPQALADVLFHNGNARQIALKDGAKGAFVADCATRIPVGAYPCKCIEPIGAGDGFNAGFLAGLLQNRSLAEAGQMGAVCGALATQTAGDIEGYPDARQLEMLLTRSEMIHR